MQRLHETDVFLRPEGTATRICQLRDGQIMEGSRVAVPAAGPVALSGEGVIAAITRKGRRLWTAQVTPELHAIHAGSTGLPVGVRAHCVALVGHRLFVGGTCDREIWVGEADVRQPLMADEESEFRTLALPTHLETARKHIDDLLVWGNRLYAVDDIVVPKWLLLYDLARGGRPALAWHRELVSHGTYGHILHGAVDSGWLAFLSTSYGRAGLFRHVAIYAAGSVEEVASLHFTVERWEDPGDDSGPSIWAQPSGLDLTPLLPAGFSPAEVVCVTGRLYLRGGRGEVVSLDLGGLDHQQVADWHRVEDRICVERLDGLADGLATQLVAVPLRDRVVAADGQGGVAVLGGML